MCVFKNAWVDTAAPYADNFNWSFNYNCFTNCLNKCEYGLTMKC